MKMSADNDFSKQLLSKLPSCDLESLCQIATAHFQNPVLLCNAMFEVTAVGSCFRTDASLNLFADGGLLRESIYTGINDYFAAYPNINDAPSFAVLKHGDITFSFCSVFDMNIPIYYVLVIEQYTSLTDDERADMSIFKDALAICLRLKADPNPQFQLMHEYFLVKLIEDELNDKRHIHLRLKILDVKLKKNLYIIAISPTHVKNISTHQLGNYIQSFKSLFVPGIVAIYKNLIVALYSTDKNNFPDHVLQALDELLKRHDLQAGVSNRYDEISQTNRYFRQALESIARGQIVHPQENLYFFNQLLVYRLLSVLPKFSSLDECVSSSIKTLIDYDRENNTELLKTLYYYVSHVCNATKAAAELCMHRNTMVYRINKIIEITKIDFSDGDTLLGILLSYKALELMAKGSDQDINFE